MISISTSKQKLNVRYSFYLWFHHCNVDTNHPPRCLGDEHTKNNNLHCPRLIARQWNENKRDWTQFILISWGETTQNQVRFGLLLPGCRSELITATKHKIAPDHSWSRGRIWCFGQREDQDGLRDRWQNRPMKCSQRFATFDKAGVVEIVINVCVTDHEIS